MQTWIALFRGINVGGNNPLPMKTLPALLEGCGCMDAKTYIQSGNAVFRSSVTSAAKLEARIGRAVHDEHGFQPRVFVLSRKELARAIAANPYPQADENPKTLHLFFLGARPQSARITALNDVKTGSESFVIKGKVLYLYTPAGFGTSKLAERAVRQLGQEATARNWRTCQKLLELATELE
jgi:uncharacterized protein (DUF1697 family)